MKTANIQQLQNAINILNEIHCDKTSDNKHELNLSSPSHPTQPPPLISTPALEELRSRLHLKTKASKKKPIFPKKSSSNLLHGTRQSASSNLANHVIVPNSHADFLNRLSTFKLTTYPAGKPRFLSPPTMASFGWINVEKNRLECQTCQSSWVLAVPSNLDWSSTTGIQLAELGKRMRIDQHRTSCPWRNRQSPTSVYQPPRWRNCGDTVKALIQNARELSDSFLDSDSLQYHFQVDHSLPEQSLATLSILLQLQNCPNSVDQATTSLTLESIILAVFGWSTKSLLEPDSDLAHSIDSFANSLPISDSSSKLPALNSSTTTTTTTKKKIVAQKVLNCRLCHRQALPLTNMNQAFNPITEHREYCPFVDKFCGFQEEQQDEFLSRYAGWEYNMEMIDKFIYRMNRPDSPNIDEINYFTLENIANQFSASHHSFQSGLQPSIADLSSTTRSHHRFDPYHLGNFESSPQISLLNYVKSVLSVSSPSSQFHS